MTQATQEPAGQSLVEVWGDTADLRHMAWAIVLGIGISLSGFLIANQILQAYVASAELARAYAMLAGLGGCILSGVVCAVLFKPKRQVVEDGGADPRWREEVIRELRLQYGSLGTEADLPPAVVQEMRELGLYALFVRQEADAAPSARAQSTGRHG